MRDYFVNRQFRKDLYVRGIRRLGAVEQRDLTMATRIVLTRPANAIPLTVTSGQGEATLHGDLFRPLIETLAARDHAPKSFGELLRVLPSLSLAQLVTAGAVLVGAGHAAPCQAEPAERQVRETCATLNRHLMERARTRGDVNQLASPVIGGGITVVRFQQLFLLALGLGCDTPADCARFTWQLLNEQGQNVVLAGRPLETPEANLTELTAQAEAFAAELLPILRAVGIA